MIPPFAVSFSSSLRTSTRSCNGVIFTVISLASTESISLAQRWLVTRTMDENSSGSSAALLRGRRFAFSDARPLFAVPLLSRVSRLRQGQLEKQEKPQREAERQKKSVDL